MKTPFNQNSSEFDETTHQAPVGKTDSLTSESEQETGLNPSDPLTFIRSKSKPSLVAAAPDSIEGKSSILGNADMTTNRPPKSLNLRTKAILNAIVLTSLPILAVGIASSVWLHSRIQPLTSQDSPETITQLQTVERQLPFFFGVGAVLSGAIAAYFANRGIRPIVNAAEQSNTIVNRLAREGIALRDRVSGQNEIVALTHNLNVLEGQLPTILSRHEGDMERFRTLMGITQKIRAALTEEELFKAAVEELRSVFRADRVAVYRLDSDIDGTIIEESVGPGFPKMLWTTLEDPCLADYLDQYQQGRIRAINDIYNAGLDDCHIGLLARFGIQANLVAPILKDQKLFGMVIVNECAKPRVWLSHEIDLLSQVTSQIGFALDFVRLLEETTQQMDQNQLLVTILRKVRSTLNEDQILQSAVTEWRKTLRVERVMVYGFDSRWYGTVLAEDVVPGVPKAINAEIYDPCFAEGYVEQYRQGRVQAVNDVQKAGLTACHLQQLEPFQVKANLVAPILHDNQLFGLLIAHACKEPRQWQSWEINLHRQLAMQVGYALEHARLLHRLDRDMNQMQQLNTLSQMISQSLDEAEILNAIVGQVRKVLQTDRVMVYRFDEHWVGTVVAESVVPGYSKALWAEIQDPCFVQGFVKQYQKGRVQAVDDIYEAGLTACHLQQLEQFEVKANLVAPILNGQTLFGLLIAHECEQPRAWQPQDITLMRQISLQVGVAVENARLLAQVEQAYQSSEISSQSQQALNKSLQQEVDRWMIEGRETAELLESNSIQQLEVVSQISQDLRTSADTSQLVQELVSTLNVSQHQMAELMQDMTMRTQQLSALLEVIHQSHRSLVDKSLSREQLGEQSMGHLDVVKDITSQLKLQAMNVALEAARLGEAGKEFADIGELVLILTRQLDQELVGVQPLMNQWQSASRSQLTEVTDNHQHLEQSVKQMRQLQDQCDRLFESYPPLQQSMDSLASVVTQQTDSISDVGEKFLELVSDFRQTSEQAIALSQIIAQWETPPTSSLEV